MRHLKLIPTPLPPDVRAQALAVLIELRTTHPFPMEVLGISEEQFFKFLLSLVQQYAGDWESLLTAGYTAAARVVEEFASQPDKLDKYLTWSIREGVLEALSREINN